jgi:hypothetical protein
MRIRRPDGAQEMEGREMERSERSRREERMRMATPAAASLPADDRGPQKTT